MDGWMDGRDSKRKWAGIIMHSWGAVRFSPADQKALTVPDVSAGGMVWSEVCKETWERPRGREDADTACKMLPAGASYLWSHCGTKSHCSLYTIVHLRKMRLREVNNGPKDTRLVSRSTWTQIQACVMSKSHQTSSIKASPGWNDSPPFSVLHHLSPKDCGFSGKEILNLLCLGKRALQSVSEMYLCVFFVGREPAHMHQI